MGTSKTRSVNRDFVSDLGAATKCTSKERSDLEQKGVFLMDDQRKGTWGDSEAERLMKALLKYARSNSTGTRDPIQ